MINQNHLEKLLNKNEIKWENLGDVVKIKNGKSWKKLNRGNVPVYGSGGVMGYVDEFSYDKPTVLIPRKGSIRNIFYVESPIWNVDTIYYTEINTSLLLPKFFYYYMKSIDLMKLDTGSGRPSLTQAILNKIPVPIPPFKVQEQIIRLLDTFSDIKVKLEEELKAELKARKNQYEHYLEKLFTFKDNEVKREKLGDVGEFTRGKRFVKTDIISEGFPCIHYGEMYTHYNIWAEETKSFISDKLATKLRIAEHGEVVIVAAGETIEDIGKGTAWLGNTGVAIHDACFSYKSSLNPKYVSYFTRTKQFHNQIKKHISSGKISAINAIGLGKTMIPIPCLKEQERIVSILDQFDAVTLLITESLLREIKLRQNQYEYYFNIIISFPKKEVKV